MQCICARSRQAGIGVLTGVLDADEPARNKARRSGPFGTIINLIFALVMRDIQGNRRIPPNRPPRSRRVVGGRRKWTDGTREDVAESAASSV